MDATGLAALPEGVPTGLSAGVAPYLVQHRRAVESLGREALERIGEQRGANPMLNCLRVLTRSEHGSGRALLVMELLGHTSVARGHHVRKDCYVRLSHVPGYCLSHIQIRRWRR